MNKPSEDSCPEKPEKLLGLPIGMYHCPYCGMMVIAGLPHPKEVNMDIDKIDIDIECYQCGTILELCIELMDGQTDHAYCRECGEGVEVVMGRTLKIGRLCQE